MLTEIETLAKELMQQHGLTDWKFGWDNAKRRLGCCHYRKRLISLSKNLTPLSELDEVRDTILHEIAHALVGIGHGHNRIWKAKAVAIGCSGRRCGKSVGFPRSFIGTCPNCKREVKAHRRNKISCGRCSKYFNPEYLFVWKRWEPPKPIISQGIVLTELESGLP